MSNLRTILVSGRKPLSVLLLALLVFPASLAGAAPRAERDRGPRQAEEAEPVASTGVTDIETTGLQANLKRLAGMSTEQWELLDVLMTLDDQEWILFKRLLRMTPEETEAMLLAIDSSIGYPSGGNLATGPVTAPGPQLPGGPANPDGPGGPTNPTEITGSIGYLLSVIVGKSNDIRNRAIDVQGKANTIISRVNVLPNLPNVRTLVQEFGVDQVLNAISLVKESFQNLIDMADELRAGFQSFDENLMKQDLNSLLDDLEEVWLIPQELACFDFPDRPIKPLKTDLLRSLIDKLPKVVLLAMNKFLDQFQPDWRTTLRDVIDITPMSLRTGICNPPVSNFMTASQAYHFRRDIGFSSQAQSPQAVRSGQCDALRPELVQSSIGVLKAVTKIAGAVFDIIAEYTPDKKTVALTINAVAGGGAGWTFDIPVKPTLKSVSILLGLVNSWFDRLSNIRESCLSQDAAVEADLLQCLGRAEYQIDLTVAREVVDRNAQQMIDLGLRTVADRMPLDNATDFGNLCVAYQTFVNP